MADLNPPVVKAGVEVGDPKKLQAAFRKACITTPSRSHPTGL